MIKSEKENRYAITNQGRNSNEFLGIEPAVLLPCAYRTRPCCFTSNTLNNNSLSSDGPRVCVFLSRLSSIALQRAVFQQTTARRKQSETSSKQTRNSTPFSDLSRLARLLQPQYYTYSPYQPQQGKGRSHFSLAARLLDTLYATSAATVKKADRGHPL